MRLPHDESILMRVHRALDINSTMCLQTIKVVLTVACSSECQRIAIFNSFLHSVLNWEHCVGCPFLPYECYILKIARGIYSLLPHNT